jgi:hypothetical protein
VILTPLAASLASAAQASIAPHPSIGTPSLWVATLAMVLAVFVLDFVITH